MSRKGPSQKIIKEESDAESDVEMDNESDAGSDIESQVDDDIDESAVLDDKDEDIDEGDDDDHDGDEIDGIYIKKTQVHAVKEESEVTIVAPEQRVTSEYMTMYEYAMVIGTRATHISEGAPIYVDTTGLSNARDIAIKEIDEKKCPLSISRKVARQIEIWEVNEMTKPLL